MSPSRRVAAIVVHFGDPGPTRRCLDSLAELDEVVLVDQPPRLFGTHPAVTRRIETAENLGFAAACNLGVAATDAEFALALNNDAVLAGGPAAELLAAVDSFSFEDDVAGACLKLLDPDGDRIQSAGGLWFTADGIGFPHGLGEVDRGQYDEMAASDVGVPSGAAALYRRSAWLEAGGMCDDFFCYCEDGDLGLRMVAAGKRFAWLPRVVARHDLSRATAAHSSFKAFHVERNHFATMVHVGRASALASLPVHTAARLVAAAWDAARGKGAAAGIASATPLPTLVAVLLRAWLGALRMLPAALRRRRGLRRHYPDGSARVADFLAAHHIPLSTFRQSRAW